MGVRGLLIMLATASAASWSCSLVGGSRVASSGGQILAATASYTTSSSEVQWR